MKTTLPTEIKTIEQAKDLLRQLHLNNESYHPDDSAETIIRGGDDERVFTDQEAEQLNKLMNEIFTIDNFDVYEYQLELLYEPQRYFVKDLSGRSGHYETTFAHLLADDELNDDEFIEWLHAAQVGETYNEFNNQTITRIK